MHDSFLRGTSGTENGNCILESTQFDFIEKKVILNINKKYFQKRLVGVWWWDGAEYLLEIKEKYEKQQIKF